MIFERGCRYDEKTGEVCIYMNKPKRITESLKGRVIRLDNINMYIDEFKNKSGIIMLSFKGIVRTRFVDFKSATIYLRGRISSEIKSKSFNHGKR